MSDDVPKTPTKDDDAPDPDRLDRFGWGDDDLEVEDDEKAEAD